MRIGDDSRASLEKSFAALQHHGTNGDATIMRSIESEIADDAAVYSAPGFLQLGNNLHRADFWGTGQSAGRERRADRVERIVRLSQLTNNMGNDVHHMAVPFHHHLFGYFDRAKL